MSSDQTKLPFYLAFHQIVSLGPVGWQRLLDYFPDVETAWHAPYVDLRQALGSRLADSISERRPGIDPAAELKKISQRGVRVVTLSDEDYPSLLKEIYAPPPLLYYRGQLPSQTALLLAVVGSRKMSAYGRQVTEQLVGELAAAGFTIVSGLALGVDGLAHQVALNHHGKTIAVLGSGIDVVYPAAHRQLAEQIVAADGALLSEFPLGTMPTKFNFPIRNRTIAGLGVGVLVTEARKKSGALITASHALEQNREVLAVPGDVTRGTAEGTNQLLKAGARVVSAADDIFELFNIQRSAAITLPLVLENETEQKLWPLLTRQPIHVDKLAQLARLDISTVSAALMIMEVRGLVSNVGEQQYCVRTAPPPLGP